MCIKLSRWFICPEPTVDVSQGASPRPPSSTGLRIPCWNWEHGEVVPAEEIKRLQVPEFDNFTNIRHLEESHIRCALVSGAYCRNNIQQKRTEFYAIPCPTCTRDDPCIVSRPPYQVDLDERMVNMLSDGGWSSTALEYFRELAALINAFLDAEVDGKHLSGESFRAHYTGIFCTQNRGHIHPDQPVQPWYPACYQDCVCTKEPWAHNISRAARRQDGNMLRLLAAREWFAYAADPRILDVDRWKAENFGDLPDQRWLNFPDEDCELRQARMVAQLGENIQKLILLGPQVQRRHNLRSGVPHMAPEAWRDILERRELLALNFIFYAARDPGLSAPFLDLLMRQCILSILNPWFEPWHAPANWEYLDCDTGAPPFIRDLVSRFVASSHNEVKLSRMVRGAQRRLDLMQVLERNRMIAFQNRVVLQHLADGTAPRGAVPTSDIIDDMQTCHICMDDFVDQEHIPYHLHTTKMLCCSKPLHFRCFKGLALSTSRCPYCNAGFETMGLNAEAAGGLWLWRQPYQDVNTGGLIHEPHLDEMEGFRAAVELQTMRGQ